MISAYSTVVERFGASVPLERSDYNNDDTIELVKKKSLPLVFELLERDFPNCTYEIFDENVRFNKFQEPRVRTEEVFSHEIGEYITRVTTEYFYIYTCMVEISQKIIDIKRRDWYV